MRVDGAVVAHEVERRDAGHGTCWHRARLGPGLRADRRPVTSSARSRRPSSSAAAATSTCAWSATATLAGGTPRRSSVGAPRCPVLVGDIAKGAAGAAIGRAVARRGEWWPGYVGGGGGDDRSCLAAVRPLPRRPQRGDARRRRRRAVAGPRGAGDRHRCRGRAGRRLVGQRHPASASVPSRSPRCIIDGPVRTAATGGLMSLVGLRFWLAARRT